VAHADLPGDQQIADIGRKIEQSQEVGDMASRLGDQFAELVLGMAMAVDQLLVALGLLDRVEVLALDILDQSDFGR
jgi:hypothetical protein